MMKTNPRNPRPVLQPVLPVCSVRITSDTVNTYFTKQIPIQQVCRATSSPYNKVCARPAHAKVPSTTNKRMCPALKHREAERCVQRGREARTERQRGASEEIVTSASLSEQSHPLARSRADSI
eukprot:Tamp_28081.p1 GENE.Tamp_28081~~Tamp_28081.p1  ORF type:complete len:123 (-),score=0.29 Tamp_28081:365-733(-)